MDPKVTDGPVPASSPKRGEKAAVDSIRLLHEGWRTQAKWHGLSDIALKVISLLASATVASFGSTFSTTAIAALGLVGAIAVLIPYLH